MKENGFKLANERSRRYPAQTITDADTYSKYTLPSRIPATQSGTSGAIGLYVNADKREYICFNQRDDISILNSGPMKLVD